jgi:hypothetical protein
MNKISINVAEQDMVLARSIATPGGVVLAAEGTALTTSLISRFKSKGIDGIWVEGNKNISESEYASIMEHIEARFDKLEQDPLLGRLKQVLVERLRTSPGD